MLGRAELDVGVPVMLYAARREYSITGAKLVSKLVFPLKLQVLQRFGHGEHLPKSTKYPVAQVVHNELVQVMQLSIGQVESAMHLPLESTLGRVQVAHVRGLPAVQVAQLGSQALQVQSTVLYINPGTQVKHFALPSLVC